MPSWTAAQELLSSVGNLLLAVESFIGLGVIVAVVSLVRTMSRDREQRRREQEKEEAQRHSARKGLLTLLDLETEQHEMQLNGYDIAPTWITRSPEPLLSTRMWEATMVRLSQLLEEEEFADLGKYYGNIFVINIVRKDTQKDERFRQQAITQGLPQLQEQCDKARAVIRRYVPEDALEGTALKNLTFDRFPD